MNIMYFYWANGPHVELSEYVQCQRTVNSRAVDSRLRERQNATRTGLEGGENLPSILTIGARTVWFISARGGLSSWK